MAERIDWQAIVQKQRPNEPTRTDREEKAKEVLKNFTPGIFDFFKGGSARIRLKLEDKVREAAAHDEKDFINQMAAYKIAVNEWEVDNALALQLLAGETQAIRQVIEEMQTLSEESLVGSGIEFSIGQGFVHACPRLHDDNVVPKFRRKQLASGRMSETKLPTSQFHELYQDYVASVALKTAGDLFQILPLEEVYVTCNAYLLNSVTGHKDWTPILSVQFVRDTFLQIDLQSIDPSDSLSNFRHSMKFSRAKGFAEIIPLEAT